MDDFEDRIERMMEQAFADAERAKRELDTAHAKGREIIQALCKPSTKRGDIIEVSVEEMPMEPAEGDEEAPTQKLKVVVVHAITGMDPDTLEMSRVNIAVGYIMTDDDITTEEDWAALYSDGPEEPQEASADEPEVEPQDPNICSCGANREMCQRNQNVFGGHLNE